MRKRLVFGLPLVILFLFFMWYTWTLRPVNAHDQVGVSVQIPSGSSVATIGRILKKEKLIRSTSGFAIYARIHRVQGTLKAGGYFLRPSMSVAEIMAALNRGFSEEMVITIPEGYTLSQIDELLAEKQLVKAGDIMKCAQTCDFSSFEFLPNKAKLASRGGKLEGYLYPDTYYVDRGDFVPKFFLERLMTTFRKRVLTPMEKDFMTSEHSLQEIVTMASLIEEETRSADERPVVSGILWKRLKAGQILGVDAAVRYIFNKPTGAITQADLEKDSPYNLRKIAGLPPGPIANPSLSSIEAALHPKDSQYWYYLHGSDGRIHYAVTNEEHNQNRSLYLK